MQALLTKAAQAGIRLELIEDDLRVSGPIGSLTPDLREALRINKAAIVASLRSMASQGQAAAWPELIPAPTERSQAFPLTDVQHAYWMGRHSLVELGQVATHFYFELDCVDLDCSRLNLAWQHLIARHDMLRAVIGSDGMQRILPEVPPYAIMVSDMSEVDAAAATAAILKTREALSHEVRPADQWPLFDVRATRLADQHVRLHISLDMLVMDAWSMFVLFQEWHQLYEHPQSPLPRIDISYRDYVLAERRLLGSAMHERARRYWTERLDTLPGAPELPIRAAGNKAGESPRFSRRRLQIDKARWAKLKTRAQAEGLTSSIVLLAAFSEVLARWSATPHFSLNLTLFNRWPLHAQVNRLVGDFTSLLLVEVDHRKPGTMFRERTSRLQKQMLEDLDHRQMSGVEVMRTWSKRRGATLQAAMPVVFTSALVLGGAESEGAGLLESFGPMVYGISQTPQVWLDHQVMEFKGDLVCNWDAVDAMFEEGVLDAMLASFTDLLDRLTDDDASWGQPEVAELPMPMLRVIKAANATEAPRCDALLHAGFIAQARAMPEAIAIASPSRTLTYGELLTESAMVAAWLKAEGVAPGQIVAVLMHKGWEQVVAVLGILMSGGAYVPIDADLPKKRQQELLQLAGVRQVLVQPGQGSKSMPAAALDAPALSVYEVRAATGIDAGADDALWLSHSIDQLAYAIFTSGTTGVPKGVLIDHRAAVNTVFHVNRLFSIDSRDSVLAVSSLSFDLSVYDIFGLLAAGGRIVMPDAARSTDPEHWLELITQHGVTVWNSAPPLMTMLMSYMQGFRRSANMSIRLALLSGDWIPVTHKREADALLPNARLIGLGGATEVSIWSIYYPLDRVEAHWKSIPYGKALPNQTMQVLNERMQVCPINVTGEIYIGGMGLARGYLNEAEKTEKQFVMRAGSGERLYRTGDLGRVLADGNIEFLGRQDTQIKLRGHRVELGEIAATLRAHPAIRDALVIADGDSRGAQTLWAYLQLDPEQQSGLMMPIDRRDQAQRCTPAAIAEAVRLVLRDKPLASLTPDTVALWDSLDTLYFLALIATLKSSAMFGRGEAHSIDEIMAKMRIAPRYRRWLDRAVRYLADRGILQQQGKCYAAPTPFPEVDLRAEVCQVERRLMQVFSLSEREAQWFTHGAGSLADILSEKTHSSELYAADETAHIYQKLFADSHMQLRLAANALAVSAGADKLRVLEVGAGLGSATQHLLPVLAPVCSRYDFTDISTYFLKRAREKFASHACMACQLFDLEQPPGQQGFEAQSYDLIIASSVLHDVSDIGRVLAGLSSLLHPGGLLLVLEETKFLPSFDLTMGLQQGFDVFADDSIRQHHPLLSRQHWRDLIERAGFSAVELLNMEGSAADYVGFDVIVAQLPAVSEKVDEEQLHDYLLARLPAYMKPNGYQVLPSFPLTPSGKIDRMALCKPSPPEMHAVAVAPATEMEQALLSIWCEVLNRNELSVDSSFFDAGGDSLLLVEVRNQIKARLGRHLPTTRLFEYPSISSLARFLEGESAQDAVSTAMQDRAARQKDAAQRMRAAHRGGDKHA